MPPGSSIAVTEASTGLQVAEAVSRAKARFGPCGPPVLQGDPGGKPGADRPDRPGPGRRRGRCGGRPPFLRSRLRRRCRLVLRHVISEPGGPAEAERAVDPHLVTADRKIGADLEVGPAELVLTCLQLCPVQFRMP